MDGKIKNIIKDTFIENGLEDVPIDYYKIDGNYKNDLYMINDSTILKVFKGPKARDHYLNELDFNQEFSTKAHLPKIEAHSHSTDETYYIFYDKIIGSSLASFWAYISDEEREEIIKKLMEDLRRIHESEEEKYSFTSYIITRIESNVRKLKMDNIFKEKEKIEVLKALEQIPLLLSKNPKFARIHNDLNFYNVYYDIHNCVIMDYEDTMIAPIDYELRHIMRMANYPKTFLNENDRNCKQADFANIKEWILKYYPEYQQVENLEERLAIYDLDYYLFMLTRTKDPEQKRKISKRAFKAALIITKNKTLTYESIKNESELMQFMELFISYGWKNKDNEYVREPINQEEYISMSIEESIKSKIASEIEQANIAYDKFKKIGLEVKLYTIIDENNKIYPYVLFYYKNNWYYFEHANKKLKGIKKYDTLNDAVKMIEYIISSELKLKNSHSVETGIIPERMTYFEIIDFIKEKELTQ